MSTEQLPGLQMAVKLLAQIGDEQSDAAIAAVHDLADEHAQRLTLQHHAADQVWRIADLEVKCVTLKELHDAATDERDALRVKVSDLERAAVKRREISDGVEAELVDECDTLRTLKIRAESERDELRAKYDELLVALHGIGRALGLAEGDRSPYSVTCGTLERVNRLAEIEAQEPVALVETSGDQGAGIGWSRAAQPVGAKLYARPVPAQAVPMSDEQRQGITLNAAQLRNALEFIAPDFDSDADQHKSEVTICWREAGTVVDDDGKPEPAGYVAWLSDYPEEGCIPLLESFESNPAPAQAVLDGCGACGDGCTKRGSCRLADESPEHKA